ncbi:hypothetical protein B0H13DRAFT_2302271 [Mycena leptocephala]|nr:hypothetical protein B0H13DRAFT_2302271 [Mycena leptocephala]
MSLSIPPLLQAAFQMMNPMLHAHAHHASSPNAPYNPLGMPPHPPPAPSLESPPVIFPREISLDEYFDHYKISADDRRVTTELGYVPGDTAITELPDKAWDATKVSPLAKLRILRQHNAFLKDVLKGL